MGLACHSRESEQRRPTVASISCNSIHRPLWTFSIHFRWVAQVYCRHFALNATLNAFFPIHCRKLGTTPTTARTPEMGTSLLAWASASWRPEMAGWWVDCGPDLHGEINFYATMSHNVSPGRLHGAVIKMCLYSNDHRFSSPRTTPLDRTCPYSNPICKGSRETQLTFHPQPPQSWPQSPAHTGCVASGPAGPSCVWDLSWKSKAGRKREGNTDDSSLLLGCLRI